MIDIPAWIASTSHSIKIGGYVAKMFKRNLKPKEQLGVTKITPVIFCGQAGGSGEYPASNDPNAPLSHIVPVDVPSSARIVNAWYSPLHNIPSILAFALIDVEPHDNTHICLKVAAFPNISARMRIAINVLYAKE